MASRLNRKHIILGVSGGIAAYKSVEILRLMKKAGAEARVVMTRNAARFVAPITFEALSGKPVCVDLFAESQDAAIRHVRWAEEADAILIAPATANIIGKLAGGIADDALTTIVLAATCPLVLCPSMNTNMYNHRAVQRNLDVLETDGVVLVEPEAGELACGSVGPGRLADPVYILDRMERVLSPRDFLGKKVLITAGPTREPIDPVRCIGNHSSGKMGFAVARAAEHRGAEVTIVLGPTETPPPFECRLIRVGTAEEMRHAVMLELDKADMVIKVAAVADYRPDSPAGQKIKKTKENDLVIRLRKNPDILAELGQQKGRRVLVGFAAETRDLKDNALEKLRRKNLDLIVGNLVNTPLSGFGTDDNQVTLFFRDGRQEALPLMDKNDLAHLLLDRIIHIAARDNSGTESHE